MAVQKQRRLGRGLSSLIQSDSPARVESPPADAGDSTKYQTNSDHASDGAGLARLIPLSSVRPSPFQPRRDFDEGSLDRLAASIARAGLMQPIIVRPAGGGGYELVAGERRWRAAQRAGLREAPAVVRDLGDEDAAEWALIENLQREDLNPMERAHGLAGLVERFGLSQAQLGERVGLDRSTVANLIRLTELENEVQAMVSAGKLQMGHARALLGMPAGAARVGLAKRAAAGGWSVRRVESAVRESVPGRGSSSAENGSSQRRAVIADIERRLGDHLGTKVRIMMQGNGARGRVQVEFFSLEQFEGLMERMGVPDEAQM